MTKNAPFATQFTTAKTITGPIVPDIGQMASMLIAFGVIVKRSIFVDPNLPQPKPAPSRPIAAQALKAATIPTPVEANSPIECAKSGRKNIGTMNAKVPTAPARKRQRNSTFLNSVRSTKGAL